MKPETSESFEEAHLNPEETGQPDREKQKIVRLFKSIVLNPEDGKAIDSDIVSFRYYNSFNYSLLTRIDESVNLKVGITSANPGEGKTLVASNLAVSLATAYQRDTILIDLNFDKPRLHEIFGTTRSPGLMEAFANGTIHISRTRVDHLFILPTGNFGQRLPWVEQFSTNGHQGSTKDSAMGLEQMAAFRDVIYSLEHEFEFIIVDMPSILTHSFPIMFTNQLNGLLVVLQAGRTKRMEIDKIFRQINEQQVLGFVVNHYDESRS